MARRIWTPEQRARQSGLIQFWKPWNHSTGAKTAEGKIKSSKNAFRFTMRKSCIFAHWLLRQSKLLRAGKAYATIEEVNNKARKCGIELEEIPD